MAGRETGRVRGRPRRRAASGGRGNEQPVGARREGLQAVSRALPLHGVVIGPRPLLNVETVSYELDPNQYGAVVVGLALIVLLLAVIAVSIWRR